MEALIADALDAAGVAYERDNEASSRLDFLMWPSGVHIEVKRMHSPRIAAQTARVDHVIVAQGDRAVEWLAGLIRDHALMRRELSETTAALIKARNAVGAQP